MKAGYSRGYYGEGQLAQPPARHRGSSWTKWALAVGVIGTGAVIWFMWPRKSEHEGSGAGLREDDSRSIPLPPGPSMERQTVLPPAQLAPPTLPLSSPCFFPGGEGRGFHSAEGRDFSHSAEERGQGHLSQQAYEDAVVASARQLQATGAKGVLAPHLAHLAHRI
jgi:hypothetical protein